jgi:hypothetical protein
MTEAGNPSIIDCSVHLPAEEKAEWEIISDDLGSKRFSENEWQAI